MNDQQLAEKLVELLPNYLLRHGDDRGGPYYIYCAEAITAEHAVHDWRVAGKCLEELRKQGYSFLLHSFPDGKALMTVTPPMPNRKAWDAQVADDDDARAICLAYVEALTND